MSLHLRDKLAHFHLDDGVLQVHLQQLGVHGRTLAGFATVGGEDPQHAHVAAHHQLVCKEETTAKMLNYQTLFCNSLIMFILSTE